MPQQARPIKCHFGRVTGHPCMEPATVEIVGPAQETLCEQHAREWLEEGLPEHWEEFGAEQYARYVEEAASQLYRWEQESDWSILSDILSQARHYLHYNELRRARAKLIEAGGKPHATEEERDMLAYFEESAREFGWTDQPSWVPRVREWIAAEEDSPQSCA